jgi:hypothetical protein
VKGIRKKYMSWGQTENCLLLIRRGRFGKCFARWVGLLWSMKIDLSNVFCVFTDWKVLTDFGWFKVSSHQFDVPERGFFSFWRRIRYEDESKNDLNAYKVVNEYDEANWSEWTMESWKRSCFGKNRYAREVQPLRPPMN